MQIKEDIEKLEDRLEWANNALKGDWSRWQKSMRADLRAIFTQTAEKNVEYYEKVSNDLFQRCFLKEAVSKTEDTTEVVSWRQRGKDANQPYCRFTLQIYSPILGNSEAD